MDTPEDQAKPPRPPQSNSADVGSPTAETLRELPDTTKPKRVARSFPASSFMEALPLAEKVLQIGGGQKVRRLTLFEQMNRSPESGAGRRLVTNSGQYNLTKGGYTAEYIELTPEGALAAGDESLGAKRIAARLELAIARIQPFNQIYENFKGNRVPVQSVLKDFAVENGVPEEHANECAETFLVNARDLGLARTSAGAERLITFEMLLEELAGTTPGTPQPSQENSTIPPRTATSTLQEPAARPTAPASSLSQMLSAGDNLTDTCFLVTPIGQADSEQRKHADLILGSLLEPALQELGLRLVRADQISKPGLITAQVIDHLVRAPLVVADLSFGNPNVFYELALRHATRKPAVQIIRSSDHLPFDVGQFRTVVIDMSDIYTLIPQIDSHRAEIARQCRAALNQEGPADSPLSLFYPNFWKNISIDS